MVELKLIFDRLVNDKDWDHIQLIKYLASKRSDLRESEISILKNRPIWPEETGRQHSIASDLYAPLSSHRDLGLPVIYWNHRRLRWSRNTDEGTLFCYHLT